jgi:membrane protein
VLATLVFLLASYFLKQYLRWITSTGYTYGALATPIAFLLFAFFMGFAVVIGAELNNAIQEEWPVSDTHARRLRWWLNARVDAIIGNEPSAGTKDEPADAEQVSPS